MYLVKSCYKEDNIWQRRTLKVGTLTEYRDTEELQIADRHEGNIKLFFNLANFHISQMLFNNLSNWVHSSGDSYITTLQFTLNNPFFPDYFFLSRYVVANSLTKHNRYIFCISELTSAEKCKDIFEKYDDYWYLNSFKKYFFGDLLSKSVINEVTRRMNEGEQLFYPPPKHGQLHVKWYSDRITYMPREVHVDNSKLYIDENNILHCISQGHMIKPLEFAHEKEMRFIFDIFCDDELLHPLNKPLFVDAEELLYLINK